MRIVDWSSDVCVSDLAAEAGLALVVGHAGELLLVELLAAAERALGVGVVVAPHQRRDPGDVPAGDRHRIVLELHVELALHVLAGLDRVRPLLVELAELGPLWPVVGWAAGVPIPRTPIAV